LAVVRNLLIRAGADFSKARASMQKFQRDMSGFKDRVSRSMSDLRDSIAGEIAGIVTVLGANSLLQDAIKVEAAFGQLSRTMGSSAEAYREWAQTVGASMGMSISETLRYGATYSQIISDFTKDNEQVLKRTQDLMKASALIVAGTGRDMTDVMDRLRSAFNQEADAADELGINVRVAALEASSAFKELANGRQWADLDQSTQRQIIYMQILNETSRRYGDTLQNNTMLRQAQFTAQVKNLGTAIGNILLPIYNAMLPILTRIASALASAAAAAATFVGALFGYDPAADAKAVQAQADAADKLGSSYQAAGDAAKDAGKKAKGAVAGFDEINQLAQSTAESDKSGASGGVAAGADAGSTAGALGDLSKQMQETANQAKQMGQKIREFFASIHDAIVQHKDVIIAALAGIGAAFLAFFLITNWGAISKAISTAIGAIRVAMLALAGSLGWVGLIVVAIGALVAAFVYFYRTNETFRGVVDGILQKIGEMAKWLWNEVFVPFGKWLADVMVKAWENLASAMKVLWAEVMVPFGKWLADVGPKAWDAVKATAQDFWKNVLVPFGNFLKALWNDVLVPVGKVIGEVLVIAFKALAAVALSLWSNVLVPLGAALLEMFKPAVEAVSAVLTYLWQSVLLPLWDMLVKSFTPAANGLGTVFQWLWQEVLKPLVTFMSDVFVTVFDNVFQSIGKIIGNLKDTFIGLMNFITGVFTGDWEKAWEGIVDVFEGIVGLLKSAFKGGINAIIAGINKLIEGLNKIQVRAPDWVYKLTGISSWGIKIPTIPKLARGGIVAGGTPFIAGEAGAEMVVPLERGDVFDRFAGAITTAMITALQMTQGGSDKTAAGRDILLSIDGVAFARLMNAYNRRESARIGSSLITVT